MQPVNLVNIQNGDFFEGLFFVTTYTKKTDFTSKAPLTGFVQYQGRTFKFKVWDAGIQSLFNNSDLNGVVVKAKGSAGLYKNELELVFTAVNLEVGDVDRNLFYKSADVQRGYTDFVRFVNENLSPKSISVLQQVFGQDGVSSAFKVSWAASRIHDAQVGGLVSHTTKMLHLAHTLITNDSRLQPWQDLIYLGIVIHDLGKIKEYGEGGIPTKLAFVGHRLLGIEMLLPHKGHIVDLYDELFFYCLLDILRGHHGEFEEKPKTVYGYIVHLIDMLESQVTAFLDSFESNNLKVNNEQSFVWLGGENLLV